MIKVTSILGLFLTSLCLTGCSSWFLGAPHAQTLYVLAGNSCQSSGSASATAPSMLIGPPKASAYIYSTRIIFSHDDQTRGSYQYAFWTDAAPDRIAMNLEQELECRSVYSKVSRNSFPGDFLVRFELLDFRHDISQSPGQVVVEAKVELLSAHSGALISGKHFRTVTPAPSYDAPGAVEGLNQAAKSIVKDMATWVVSATKSTKP